MGLIMDVMLTNGERSGLEGSGLRANSAFSAWNAPPTRPFVSILPASLPAATVRRSIREKQRDFSRALATLGIDPGWGRPSAFRRLGE